MEDNAKEKRRKTADNLEEYSKKSEVVYVVAEVRTD